MPSYSTEPPGIDRDVCRARAEPGRNAAPREIGPHARDKPDTSRKANPMLYPREEADGKCSLNVAGARRLSTIVGITGRAEGPN